MHKAHRKSGEGHFFDFWRGAHWGKRALHAANAQLAACWCGKRNKCLIIGGRVEYNKSEIIESE